MYATLIIKNIGNLYTCDDHFTIYHHAFVALYHDKIIDVGEHDYHKWIEDCTFVIDAASRAVIPGLIEANFPLKSGRNKSDSTRKTNEALNYHQKNGTTTLITKDKIHNHNPLLIDLIKVDSYIPVVKAVSDFKEDSVISCSDVIYSLHAMGFLLVESNSAKAWQALKSMTCNAAMKLGLEDRGSIEIGKIGDLLVLTDTDINSFYKTIGHPLFAHIIKKGIPVFPEIRRV